MILLLVALVPFFSLNPFVSAGSIKLEAHPKEIDVFNTKTLTINCTYESNDVTATTMTTAAGTTTTNTTTTTATNNNDQLMSLILSKVPLSGVPSPMELASVDRKSTLHILDASPPTDVTYSGHVRERIGGGNGSTSSTSSYVSGRWGRVSQALAGSYICEANVMDAVGRVVTYSTQTTVVEETNSLSTFLDEVRKMQNELEVQQTCCLHASAQIAEIQAWRTAVGLSVSFLEKSLLLSGPSQTYKNKTYLASKYKADDVIISEAVCKTVGGYLAEIDDQGEFQVVTSLLEGLGLTNAHVAGRDDVTEGTWYFTRTQKPMAFTAWTTGQPDDAGSGEDCVELINNGNWYMNDIPCQVEQRDSFVCEVPDN